MSLLIGSAVLAFLTWCLADTRLKSEHVQNSEGKITFGRTLSVVLIQIVLWAIVFLFGSRIIPHLPAFLTTGWRLPVSFFVAAYLRWFALLMLLQYVWVIVRATGKTTTMAVLAAFGSRSAKQALDAAPFRFTQGGKQEERFRSRERDSEP
jgi:uncharacterized protein YqhQ